MRQCRHLATAEPKPFDPDGACDARERDGRVGIGKRFARKEVTSRPAMFAMICVWLSDSGMDETLGEGRNDRRSFVSAKGADKSNGVLRAHRRLAGHARRNDGPDELVDTRGKPWLS
jgi:hypothetical protein